ncbi:MAG: bifunctional phosphopantothenoylcysteine decarboxylase/phosphopantothenate--cysteine ligase CoaBC [Candidatus Cloacimonetes bacterium HGW-Cloacimonetes-1]|jgi:phosphopantothenoylcysteine decarboxylase/phosphopantothenate--cysteine ligase|nr:MAG: bifunctional phosphopantothenoylcysteine decarboxylase/phosphopantothenate--cysteine ligase CoaBC [Candidatus Cloacimonetes bacterium HGW-Cloacimonetes-1]
MNDKKNILLCVTGGIAAYKAIDLASALIKNGYNVKTVMTRHACEFVTPINFEAITHNTVHTEQFMDNDPIPHITLADWADMIVVAPATANILSKAAQGIGDDLLSSLLLAHTKPVLFVPAMNVHMYEHPATVGNVRILRSRSNHVLEPSIGLLACGYSGKGKYPPNEEVLVAIATYMEHGEDLHGIKCLITAGATSEAIDPMRMISNKSSGKMGIALARAATLRGAEVTLIAANPKVTVPYQVHKLISVNTAQEMHAAVMAEYREQNWIIKCAAVSDYRPQSEAIQKIKKGSSLTLELIPTLDILSELGKLITPAQKLIGFAAETENILSNARAKLIAKNCDLLIANDLKVAGTDHTDVTIISKDTELAISGTKIEVANVILNRIADHE